MRAGLRQSAPRSPLAVTTHVFVSIRYRYFVDSLAFLLIRVRSRSSASCCAVVSVVSICIALTPGVRGISGRCLITSTPHTLRAPFLPRRQLVRSFGVVAVVTMADSTTAEPEDPFNEESGRAAGSFYSPIDDEEAPPNAASPAPPLPQAAPPSAPHIPVISASIDPRDLEVAVMLIEALDSLLPIANRLHRRGVSADGPSSLHFCSFYSLAFKELYLKYIRIYHNICISKRGEKIKCQ